MAHPRRGGLGRRGKKAWPPALALLVLLLVLASCAPKQAHLDTLWDAPSFNLTDETGAHFASTSLAGQVWVVDFIYTNCPDLCPIYLSPKMRTLQGQIKDRHLVGHVQLLSITVDPRRDAPPVLASYASRYGADPQIWHFLTGPNSTIQSLMQNGFKVGAAIVQMPMPTTMTVTITATAQAAGTPILPANYTLQHTSLMLLVDQHGKIRKDYDATQVDVTEIAADVEQLAQATQPPANTL